MASSEQRVNGIPSVSYSGGIRVQGGSDSHTPRVFTILKTLGRGQSATVALCDWKSTGTLPPGSPLPVMQSGRGAKPEWRYKRLVAVKKLNEPYARGWDECRELREVQAHQELQTHPNIVELYDAFVCAETKTLHLVFEAMEGNLYQLIKARKGRTLAGGLVCLIFSQLAAAIGHLHSLNIFHRDLTPENVLVSTTGLFDYRPVGNGPREKDVVAVVKLCDFGLACRLDRDRVYTQYVGVRWYRAPEALLRAASYSKPVDMWALGVVIAEVILLKPMFPGTSHIDQFLKIISVLGNPSDAHGVDSHGDPIGGGSWPEGVVLASEWGITLPIVPPIDLHVFFGNRLRPSLVRCIRQLLRYDPIERLSAMDCLNHAYFRETIPINDIPDLSAPHLFE